MIFLPFGPPQSKPLAARAPARGIIWDTEKSLGVTNLS